MLQASKHAVLGLTRSLAVEPGKDGIRVMAIAPGLTVAPGNEELLDEIRQAGHTPATLSAPLGRFKLADDIREVRWTGAGRARIDSGSDTRAGPAALPVMGRSARLKKKQHVRLFLYHSSIGTPQPSTSGSSGI